MSTLDLHGIKHADVEDTLTKHFFWNQPGHKHYTVITGDSPKMRTLVTEWLKKYEYKYWIPSHNPGEIQISE